MAKKKKCQARGCDVIIKMGCAFCAYHWSLLPADDQDELAEAFETANWNRAIGKARAIIRDKENNLE